MNIKTLLEELLPKLTAKENQLLRKEIRKLKLLSGSKKEEELKAILDRINAARKSDNYPELNWNQFMGEVKRFRFFVDNKKDEKYRDTKPYEVSWFTDKQKQLIQNNFSGVKRNSKEKLVGIPLEGEGKEVDIVKWLSKQGNVPVKDAVPRKMLSVEQKQIEGPEEAFKNLWKKFSSYYYYEEGKREGVSIIGHPAVLKKGENKWFTFEVPYFDGSALTVRVELKGNQITVSPWYGNNKKYKKLDNPIGKPETFLVSDESKIFSYVNKLIRSLKNRTDRTGPR